MANQDLFPSSLQRAAAWLIAAATCACSTAHYPINEQLTERHRHGYSLRNLPASSNSDSLIVMMTLSGGGYRAATMAYAAIEVLDQTTIQWEGTSRSLLDELDLISAVSGGSLAAAYFASHPNTFLTDFRRHVLDLDLQSAYVRRTFSLSGLWRQTSPTFGRGDLLQELLDEHVFGRLRYADLPRRRPMVYINATDMRQGRRFEFSQDQFDHLCSDLNAMPLARAVAASMAVPVLMSPITVWNHKRNCASSGSLFPVSGRAAESRYIHLVDGGLADNTGLSAVLENVSVHGGLVKSGRASGLRGVRKRVIIVVNAQVNRDLPEDLSPHTPGLLRQLRSAVDVPIDRHAEASLQILAETVRHWQHDLRETSRAEGRGAADDFHVIELSISNARSVELASALKAVPTGLRILPGEIDLIRNFVRQELALHPQWQRLLRELGSSQTELAQPIPPGSCSQNQTSKAAGCATGGLEHARSSERCEACQAFRHSLRESQ